MEKTRKKKIDSFKRVKDVNSFSETKREVDREKVEKMMKRKEESVLLYRYLMISVSRNSQLLDSSISFLHYLPKQIIRDFCLCLKKNNGFFSVSLL